MTLEYLLSGFFISCPLYMVLLKTLLELPGSSTHLFLLGCDSYKALEHITLDIGV